MSDSPTWPYSNRSHQPRAGQALNFPLTNPNFQESSYEQNSQSQSLSIDHNEFGRSLLLECDTPFRTSIQRAQDALRESRRARVDEDRRVLAPRRPISDVASRDRNFKSQDWAQDQSFGRRMPSSVRHVRHHRAVNSIDSGLHGDESSGDGSNDERPRYLHKSRSIPLSMMTSPRPQLQPKSTPYELSAVDRASISPPRRLGPRRALSHGNLLNSSTQPIVEKKGNLPQLLPVPTEPTSKFSASSCESRARTSSSGTLLSRGAKTLTHAGSIKNLLARKNTIRSQIPTRPSTIAFGTRWSTKLAAVTESTPVSSATTGSVHLSLKSGTTGHHKVRPSVTNLAIFEPVPLPSIPRSRVSRLPGRLNPFPASGTRYSDTSSLCSPSSNGHTDCSSPFSKRDSSTSACSKESSVRKTFSRLFNRSIRRNNLTSTPREAANDELTNVTVHKAEKITVPEDLTGAIQVDVNTLPARIPISSIFPAASKKVSIPLAQARLGPTRPRRPITPGIEPYTTTFGGQVLVGKSSSVRRQTSASKRRRSSIPLPSDPSRRSSLLVATSAVAVARQEPAGADTLDQQMKGSPVESNETVITIDPSFQPQQSVDSLPCSLATCATSTTLNVSEFDPDQTTLLDSSSSDRSTRSFRCPSPARFRDLLPSESASSSPVKSERGLPLPSHKVFAEFAASPSPKKRAMGPEQVIVMEHAPGTDGIRQTRGATTDLAELLSSLDDTEDMSTRIFCRPSHEKLNLQDLVTSVEPQHSTESTMEQLELVGSMVADVPDDLQTLIQSVTDHISEIDIDLDISEASLHYPQDEPEFGIIGTFDAVRYAPQTGKRDSAIGQVNPFDAIECLEKRLSCFVGDQEPPFVSLSNVQEDDESESEDSDEDSDEETDEEIAIIEGPSFIAISTTAMDQIVDEGGFLPGSTLRSSSEFSPNSVLLHASTDSSLSLPIHITTAADVLHSMLRRDCDSSPDIAAARWDDEEDDSSGHVAKIRESLEDYLTMERPTIGDKMLDRLDAEVSLTSLIAATSPPPSIERRVEFDHSRRLGSTMSSSDESGESFPEGIASPSPATRRKVQTLRQSLVRYSQDRSRVRVGAVRGGSIESILRHADRDFSELDQAVLAESGMPGLDLTTCSLPRSSHSTNLSISSVTSSPCPVPRSRKIPMLTNVSPPNAPSFVSTSPPTMLESKYKACRLDDTTQSPPDRTLQPKDAFSKHFSPLDQFRAKQRGEANWDAELTEDGSGLNGRTIRARPKSQAEDTLKASDTVKAPTSLATAFERITSPDTRRARSSVESLNHVTDDEEDEDHRSEDRRSRPASLDLNQFEIDYVSRPPMVTIRAKAFAHARQASRASSFIQETIIEDDREANTSSTENSPVRACMDAPQQILGSGHTEPERPSSSILEPIQEGLMVQKIRLDEIAAYRISLSPTTATDGIANTLVAATQPNEPNRPEEEDIEEEVPYERHRDWVHYTYEAQDEMRRSKARWLDTDRSKDALQHFIMPIYFEDIMDFIYASRLRYRNDHASNSRSSSLQTPSPMLSPGDVSNPSPIVSPDSYRTNVDPTSPTVTISPEFDRAMPKSRRTNNESAIEKLSNDSPKLKRKAAPVFRILRDASHLVGVEDKLRVDSNRDELGSCGKGQAEASGHSPFTALPPRLALRKRRPSVLSQAVDISFLNSKMMIIEDDEVEEKATIKCRQDQFDMTRRKLEGIKEVQMKSFLKEELFDHKDEKVVLEAEGMDENNAFPKTPRLSTSRPRVRARKTVLSSLR